MIVFLKRSLILHTVKLKIFADKNISLADKNISLADKNISLEVR
jgi:hypothetical protein